MWFLKDVLLGAAATCALTSCLADKPAMASPPPPPPITSPAPPVKRGNASQSRIEARITGRGRRCMVPVTINGNRLELLADSGSPDVWLPTGDLPKLGIERSSLSFSWFGPRERNVAWVTLPELKIGDFVARNVETAISEGESMRLLGMSVLKQGRMEIQGETCVLTFPRNAAVASAVPQYVPPPRPAQAAPQEPELTAEERAAVLAKFCGTEGRGSGSNGTKSAIGAPTRRVTLGSPQETFL